MLGIFDSGIGGLTVVKELLRRVPDASFLYLGDTARTPYGTKGEETIIRYGLEDAKFLIDRGATALIVACNTVSAYAISALKAAYPTIPVFDVLSPAISATTQCAKTHVGVIGTSATIRSGAYERALTLVRPDLEVTSIACPLFVPLVEEGWMDDDVTRAVVKRYLTHLKEAHIDTMILGCTHYPLLQPLIAEEMGPEVTIVDSPGAIMDQVMNQHPDLLSKEADQQFWFTDLQPTTASIAGRWLEREVEPQRAELG
jgi:glutamate racemase